MPGRRSGFGSPCPRPRPGLGAGFGEVGGAVHRLQVREAPIGQELGPGRVAVPAPHEVERHAVVHLAVARQAPARHGATPLLQTRQELRLVGGRGPDLPGRRTAGVPAGPAVGLAPSPQVAVPAEAVDRLAAQAAGAGPGPVGGLAEGRGRHPEAARPPVAVLHGEAPAPALRHGAARRQRPREPVGPQRMVAPVAFHGEARLGRDQRPRLRVHQDGAREDGRQGFGQPGPRQGVAGVPPGRGRPFTLHTAPSRSRPHTAADGSR